MKFKQFLFITFLVALQLSFISCNKHEPDYSLTNDKNSTTKSDSIVDPSNIYNSEDSTGILHNILLNDFFIMYIERYSQIDNFDSAKAITYSYFDLSNSQINTINLLDGYALQNYEDYDETMKSYYNSNTKVLSLYLQIKEIAVNLNLTLAEKISRIKIIENNYVYTGLSNDQIINIKKGLSIVRYSLSYWAPISQGGQGKLDNIIDSGYKASINWGQIGIEDAWGAWIGAFSTANPFGALAGGAACSAVLAVREYIRNN